MTSTTDQQSVYAPYDRMTGALPIGYHISAVLARGFSEIGFFVMEFFRAAPRSACLRGFFARKTKKSGGKSHVGRQERLAAAGYGMTAVGIGFRCSL